MEYNLFFKLRPFSLNIEKLQDDKILLDANMTYLVEDSFPGRKVY